VAGGEADVREVEGENVVTVTVVPDAEAGEGGTADADV
jgi:hypothetical protein